MSQSTISSDTMTITTGVISVSKVVVVGSLNNGTNVEGNMEKGDGGDSESSITLRKVMMTKNVHC